ncbi:Atu2307/SP_0267 family LLM class monooxygenase [Mucilaginibacter sp. X4EP1]|uniref:Atu2307/SP_0267 family LLM class monooxygenase n=1 Tax=Mucilaginibacter sp. X4EP1 TaxID=2723092 RepID=UPI002169A851|nr:Atu2307/SP_0267 family LLM class monooxygenase [Mucilaginibacter sp. X4EP1]MCS3812005.1 putative LLM family oxidoreductase [Mucilaginibacter sp. X4EP1]
MEIGIDSFASTGDLENPLDAEGNIRSMSDLLKRIEFADECGIDFFGIGEHHRKEFLDSATAVILAAAAARTKRIKLSSAVTVLSASDPVRVFQNFATLDIISGGRAEIIAGRGSFIEAFGLFGFKLEDYDALFDEKIDLLLKIRDNETITWSGKFRPSLVEQSIYPRPVQKKLPIWIGVGGTPESFIRAGLLGLPLMVAIIGGDIDRFKPLVDLYRKVGKEAGFGADVLRVGVHTLGYVADTKEKAIDDYYPGYAKTFTKIGRERGWPPVTKEHFLSQIGPAGAMLIGSPEEVALKIKRHNEVLGGITHISFQMDNAMLSPKHHLSSIELIGKKVKPLISTI